MRKIISFALALAFTLSVLTFFCPKAKAVNCNGYQCYYVYVEYVMNTYGGPCVVRIEKNFMMDGNLSPRDALGLTLQAVGGVSPTYFTVYVVGPSVPPQQVIEGGIRRLQ